MKISRQDLLAPANFITLVGFALTVAGSAHLQTKFGFGEAVLGRLLDTLDGPVARRTHTSRFGAVFDATVDKLSVLAMVAGLLAYGLAPVPIVLYVLLQNGIVTVSNLIAAYRHIVVQTVHSGKRNMFLQTSAMFMFALATFCNGVIRSLVLALAYVLFIVSVFYAARATLEYMHAHPNVSKRLHKQ